MIPPHLQPILDRYNSGDRGTQHVTKEEVAQLTTHALSLPIEEMRAYIKLIPNTILNKLADSQELCQRIAEEWKRVEEAKKVEDQRRKVEHERLHEGTGTACPSCPN